MVATRDRYADGASQPQASGWLNVVEAAVVAYGPVAGTPFPQASDYGPARCGWPCGDDPGGIKPTNQRPKIMNPSNIEFGRSYLYQGKGAAAAALPLVGKDGHQ